MLPVQWVLGVLYLAHVAAAFPAIPQRVSSNGIEGQCSDVALKVILDTLQLPLPVKSKYSLRYNNRLPDYLASVTGDFRIDGLGSLLSPNVDEDVNNQSPTRVGTGNDLRNLLEEFIRLRNECVLRNGGSYGIDGATYTDDISAQMEDIVPVESRNTFSSAGTSLKRAGLALNPTGWRRKRDAPPQNKQMREFLRNIRQLQIKREQRLQFNPTGW